MNNISQNHLDSIYEKYKENPECQWIGVGIRVIDGKVYIQDNDANGTIRTFTKDIDNEKSGGWAEIPPMHNSKPNPEIGN